MTQSALASYKIYTTTLNQDSLSLSAAELHGLLTGVLCAGVDEKNHWLVLLFDYTNQGESWPKSSLTIAETLYEQTLNELKSELMDFSLLQPSEDLSVIEQADALVEWVNHFLAGFGVAGTNPNPSAQSKEILEDLVQIAQLGIDEDEDENLQLALLNEVREHVRICALSLFADNLLTPKTPRAKH